METISYGSSLGSFCSRTCCRRIGVFAANGLVEKVGTTGLGTYYRLLRKPDTNPTNPT